MYSTQFTNNNICSNFYCKFHLAHWFLQNVSVDFSTMLVSAAKLWWSLTNECRSNMNMGWDLHLVKQRRWRCKSELHSFISDVNNFCTESNNSFWILEEYFLRFFGGIHNATGTDMRHSWVYSTLLTIPYYFLESRPGFLNFTIDISDQRVWSFFVVGAILCILNV